MKFAALNKEVSNNSTVSTPSGKKGRPTLEAQESACLEVYHSAMRLQQDGDLDKAKDLYREILESELMEEACNVGGISQNSTMSKLKYLVYKNIAGIAREQGDLSAAVDAYIEASTVDTSDVTMWCQLASAASLLGNLLLARKSLEYALDCNNVYWPALESLCTVLFALEDFHSCLLIIKKGLELDPEFPRGLVYLHHIAQHCPDLIGHQLAHLRFHLMKPSPPQGEVFLSEASELSSKRRSLHNVVVLPETIVPTKKLNSLTVYNLATSLLALYKHCKELSKTKASFVTKIDISSLFDKTDEPMNISPTKKVTIAGAPGGSPKHERGSPKHVGDQGGMSSSGDEGKKDAKRRLLDELEPFAPKRRSTRVRTKTANLLQNQSYFEMLSKYIPPWLEMSDLPDIGELSPLKKHRKEEEDKQSLQEQQRQLSALFDSTHQLNEGEVVKDFLKSNEDNTGILNLLNRFLLFFALRYDYKWAAAPFPVVRLFVELYECLHPHLTFPSPFCSVEDAQQSSFKSIAMVAMCYIEMYVDCVSSRKGVTIGRRLSLSDTSGTGANFPSPPKAFTECALFIKQCAGLVGASDKERTQFALRVSWCLAKWDVLDKDNDAATGYLLQCKRMLENDSVKLDEGERLLAVCLPNVKEDQVITLDRVRDKIKQLEQCVSFKQIHDLFVGHEYSLVVDKLLPLFDQDPNPPLELIVGRDKSPLEEKTSLSLLLTSLLHLRRYHTCLQTSLQAILTLLSRSNPGNEKWASALKELFVTVDSCLPPVACKGVGGAGSKDDKEDHKDDKRDQKDDKIDMEIDKQGQIDSKADTGSQRGDDKIDENSNKMNQTCDNTDQSDSDKMDLGEQSLVIAAPSEVCTREDLLERCGVRLLKRLVVSVVKTMDIVADMADSPVHHCLPIALTWKIFYTLIASKWKVAAKASTYQPTLSLTASPSLSSQPPTQDQENPLFHLEGPQEPMDTDAIESNTVDAILQPPTKVVTQPVTLPVTPTSTQSCTEPEQTVIATSTQHKDPSSNPSPTTAISTPTSSKDVKVTPPSTAVLSSQRQPSSDRGSQLTPSPVVSLTKSSSTKSPSVTPPVNSSLILTEDMVELAPSLKFLIEAHDHLGRIGWCCKESGCFLKSSVDSLRSELKLLTKLPPKHRQMLLVELEQCYYCLFGHPQKRAKARGLAEHSSPQVPLTWDFALMLMEYFHPSPLPSIDDSKSPQVTSELVSLYKRIVDVVPEYGRVISLEDLNGYIDGTCTESMMVYVTPHQHSSTISELYYLLADDALKGGDNHKAIRYYLSNLCYCPDRFDSWAGLALARTRKIVERLNMRDFKSGMERYVQKQTAATVRCFEKAMSLNNKHCYVVEKFGFFCYTIQSFTSQILHQPEVFLLKDSQTWASESLGEMLLLARKCFEQALALGGSRQSEPWLYQLMMGKIGHKLSRPLKETLEFFINSSESLCSDSASYPEYVELSSKHHALEAIEVHYQLHSCILKSLLDKSDGQVKQTTKEQTLKRSTNLGVSDLNVRLESLPLGGVKYPSVWNWVCDLVDGTIESGAKKPLVSDKTQTTKDKVCLKTMSSATAPLESLSKESRRDEMDTVERMYVTGSTSESKFSPAPIVHVTYTPSTLSKTMESHQTIPNSGLSDKTHSVIQMAAKLPIKTADNKIILKTQPASNASSVEPMTTHHQNQSHTVPVLTSRSLTPSTEPSGSDTSSWQATQQPEHCVQTNRKHFDNIDTELLKKSMYAIAVCVVRCPAYFKSIYRMSAVCFELGLTSVSKDLLLGPLPSVLLEQQEKLLPLFALKPNIFCNMWQIPTEEINRPGNFSTHARSNLNLLLKVLLQLSDVHSLTYLTQHLRHKPEVSKQYMRDNERVVMFQKAARYSALSMKSAIQSIPSLSQEELCKLQTTASVIRPIVIKIDDSGQELTKGIDRAIELLRTAILPQEQPPAGDTPPPISSVGGDLTSDQDSPQLLQPNVMATVNEHRPGSL